MKKNFLIALPLAALLALPAGAQQSSNQSSNDTQQSSQANSGTTQATATQGNREPLQVETHEGFWGKLNPFARKKYVQRQVEPVKNRVNELDELTATNSKGIRDVDSRASEGIRVASAKANEADQHALAAGQQAQLASQTAQQTTARLQTVEQVVGNLDDYKPANQAEIRYKAGTTVLSKNAKQALDEMVANVQGQRGYIIQIQGFAPGQGQAAIQNSQHMAQAVARYLALEHQIPVFRIFTVGMGNVPVQSASANGKPERVRAGRVDVTLLKNSVDQLAQAGSGSAATENQGGVAGTTQPSNTSNGQTTGQGSMGTQPSQPSQPQSAPPQNH